MTTNDSDDLIDVNCGRGGKPLIPSVEDLRDKRTIDREEYEKRLPVRERSSRRRIDRTAPSR
jgi:hypothetical protein